MLHERQAQILRLLQQRPSMTTRQLAAAVYASLPTVRRDLNALESRGLIRRVHGGAALMEPSQRLEIPLLLRQGERTREKTQIARQALALIPAGSTLFLDASSTAWQLARLLPRDQELTVITNSLKAAALLCQRHIRAYIVGGLLNEDFLASGGGYAEEMVRGLRVGLMFFSANALTADGEVMDFSESETKLRQAMFARAGRKYFLCDSSKIGQTSLHHLCWIDEVDGALCEAPLPEPLARRVGAQAVGDFDEAGAQRLTDAACQGKIEG